MSRSPTDLVLKFIESVNRKDWKGVREVVSPTFFRHSRAGGDIHGVDALISFLQSEYETFPDAEEQCKHHFSTDDMVATIMEFSGTQRGPLGPHAATGIHVSAPYMAIYRIENGMIVESWAEWDNFSTLQVLGHIK